MAFRDGTANGLHDQLLVASDVANGAIVPLATADRSSNEIAAFNGGAGLTNIILDVTGYFKP